MKNDYVNEFGSWFNLGLNNCLKDQIKVVPNSEECRTVIIDTKYGKHKVNKASLNKMTVLPKSNSSLDINNYWRLRIKETKNSGCCINMVLRGEMYQTENHKFEYYNE